MVEWICLVLLPWNAIGMGLMVFKQGTSAKEVYAGRRVCAEDYAFVVSPV